MTTPNETHAKNEFSILIILMIVACSAVIQTSGANASIPIATAAAMLVFYIRHPVVSTWDHLVRLYETRVPQEKC